MDESEREMLMLQDFVNSVLGFELAAFADSGFNNTKVTYFESIYNLDEIIRKSYLGADDYDAGKHENSSQSLVLKPITLPSVRPNK